MIGAVDSLEDPQRPLVVGLGAGHVPLPVQHQAEVAEADLRHTVKLVRFVRSVVWLA